METGEAACSERAVSIVSWLALAWAALLVVGAAYLMLGQPLGVANPVSPHRAIFTSVSTATLSGFSQAFAQVDHFDVTARLIFLLQTVSGALLGLLGGALLIARLVGSAHSERAIATTTLVLIGFAALLGAVFIAPGDDLLAAASRGVGALAGSGLSFGAARSVNDPLLHVLLLPLGLLGGAGIIVVLDLLRRVLQRTPITPHAFAVLVTLAIGYLVSGLLIFLCIGDWTKLAVLRSSAVAIAGQGFGHAHEPVSQLRGVSWVLIAVMLTGVGTLSTAGGWGWAWFVTVPRRQWSIAVIGVAGTLAIVLVSAFTLTFTDPQEPADRVLLLSVASVTNAGVAPEPVSMPTNGLVVLSAVMIAGRLLPLVLVSYSVLRHSAPKKLTPPDPKPHSIVDNSSKARRKIGEKGEAR